VIVLASVMSSYPLRIEVMCGLFFLGFTVNAPWG